MALWIALPVQLPGSRLLFTIKTPGKLMLAGEWSILEIGNSCVVLPINRFVTTTVHSSSDFVLHAPDVFLDNIQFSFNKILTLNEQLSSEQEKRFSLTRQTIELTLQYLQEVGKKIQPCTFNINSQEMLYQGKKIGLGSSAAVCVSVCTALIKQHGYDVEKFSTKMIIFKLACIAHFLAQGKCGSGFDIAASTFQVSLHYKRFDPDWLAHQVTIQSLKTIIHQNWPHLHIEHIMLPTDLHLSVGYVGKSASTTQLVQKIRQFKKQESTRYKEIFHDINEVVLELLKALKMCNKQKFDSSSIITSSNRRRHAELVSQHPNVIPHVLTNELYLDPEKQVQAYAQVASARRQGDISTKRNSKSNRTCSIIEPPDYKTTIIDCMKKNRKLLRMLDQEANVALETPELITLIDTALTHADAAKFSGAGGGDCGIALSFTAQKETLIHALWRASEIVPLDVQPLQHAAASSHQFLSQ